ncbi:DHA2 family efflux MFS transporter permease subunit [Roseomonas sp. KE2513]|uniref:MDR family MFS transporter n=1 Tax=Roseomonas sp. KE2513 TaxID=2479202 RepID=UPI0018E03624|nr:MDR family MFS transporter [Roseomonas sp. KE2513]MBI0534453.1 DHA2 family efflux MFS transporter permease subunit [Roseomonas sp. KE2513]
MPDSLALTRPIPDTAEPAPPGPRPERPASRRVVMTGALLSILLASLDQNIVNTALPRIVSDLGGMAHLSWVVTAFMLSSTVTTPLYGKLSDTYGRRKMFLVAIGLFLAGSLLCGTAGSMGQLILFRALQGLGAGGLMVLAQASVGDVVSPRERPRYQGLFTGTFALASVAGPLLGGIITSTLSWRWVFYVNLPVGAVALLLIGFGLRTPVAKRKRPLDILGTVLMAAGTTALLLFLAWGGVEFPWVSAASAGGAALVIALFAAFLWRETRAEDPLVRLGLFRNPVFARGVSVGGMMVFAMLGSTVFLPLYFQLVLGMSPARAGAMMLPQVIGMVLTSVFGGRAAARLGRNKGFLMAGLALEAVALAGLAGLAWLAAPAWTFLVAMGALGLGMGMGMPNLTTAVQNAVAYKELGAATGAMTFMRSLGGAVGVACSGAILSARLAGPVDVEGLTRGGAEALAALTPAQHAVLAEAYRTALTGCFALSGAVMTAAFLLVIGLPEQKLRSTVEEGAA